MAFIVYQSEFQHCTIDDLFSERHTMLPAPTRTREPVAVGRLAAHLHKLLTSDDHQDQEKFDRLTSNEADVVHLCHARHVIERYRYVDALLIGTSSPRTDTNTEPLAELLGSVFERQTSAQIGFRTLGVTFEQLLSAHDDDRRTMRQALRETLNELAGNERPELRWDACFASVRGPASAWLHSVLAVELPTAIPIHTVERANSVEPLQSALYHRTTHRDRHLVSELMRTGARARQRDMVNVVDQIIAEARQVLAEGAFGPDDRRRLEATADGEFNQ